MCAAGICDARKYSELKFLILPFKISQDVQVLSFRNPPACRRVLWILLVRSCTVCFVFVLSRLSPWRGFLPRLTWTHSLPPSYSFRLDLSLRCGGLNSAHASHNTGLILHILLSFRWLFPFFCCVCHRFAPSLLISNAWSTGFCAEHLLHA
jgi:hypothetical protein